jgi:hypothetical protein
LKRIGFGLAVAGLSLVIVGTAMAGQLGTRLDRDSAHGKHAHAHVDGSMRKPRKIFVKVKARPAQVVESNWGIGCFRSDGTSDSRSATTKKQTPFIETLRFPFHKPNDCSGDVDVWGHGHLKAVLYGQRR